MIANAVSPAPSVTIYALVDPDSGEVRYVGQTKNVWKRYGTHLTMMQGSVAKQGWFLELQQRQQLPVLKILEAAVERSQAKIREQWWINYYRGDGADLVNAKATRGPRGTLSDLLYQHGIHTIRKLCQETGLSRQRGWMLWWGKAGVGKQTAKLLHEKLGIPLEELMEVDPVPYDNLERFSS
jgi:hypothetical protein